MTFEKRIRLASAAVVFAGAALMAAEPAAARENWEPCSCEEENGVIGNAYDECSQLGWAPDNHHWYQGVYCWKRYAGAGHWDFSMGWSCVGGYDEPQTLQPIICE